MSGTYHEARDAQEQVERRGIEHIDSLLTTAVRALRHAATEEDKLHGTTTVGQLLEQGIKLVQLTARLSRQAE